MQVQEKQQLYTPDEYLALEARAEFKSEYRNGIIVPITGESNTQMTGGSTNHNRIAGNFYAALNLTFRQQDYEVFMENVRLWIPKKLIFTYPNIMVIAGTIKYYQNRTDTILNPQVIVEVLSKSMEGYDQEDKFRAYKTLPSFQEYVLIDQTEQYVEQFVKTDVKRWSLRDYDTTDEELILATVPAQISLTNLYNKVQFESVATTNEATEG